MIKKTKSSPLIKALLKGNEKRLFLVFLGSLMVAVFDSLNVMLYSQVINNLDEHPEEQIIFFIKLPLDQWRLIQQFFLLN